MKIAAIAWFELRRMATSRSVLMNQFLLPLLLIFILGNALSGFFGGGQEYVQQMVRVGIIAEGPGREVPASLQSVIDSPEVEKLLVPTYMMDRETAEKQLRSGDLDYAVIILQDWEQRISSGEETRLELLPGKDRELNLIADTVFKSYTAELNHRMADAAILGMDSMSAWLAAGGETAPGPFVEVGQMSEQGATYSAAQYYSVSMLVMFLLYSGLMASVSLFEEKDSRTLYRLQSAPVPGSSIFIGKLTGASLIAVIQAVVIVLGSMWLFGVEWGDRPLFLVLVCMLVTLGSMALAVVVTLFSRTAAGARGVMQTVIIAMTFVSGGFTPIAAEWVQQINTVTVNFWAMQSLLRIMLHSSGSEILFSMGMLAVVCVGLTAVAWITYRKVGYHA
ncbi:ABC transporter permease subunit [Paenibacillus campinasensis]|uniref:ABC transporter permease subunit n=1 Tax=Paenibacillus campinasensis TaxID=66347 RepID=A0ABW9T7L1_9BACL|nr:ABC transporter permease [Paenibacillus campinasensis]MUG68120.1 ABC transporter permease subunit [Paenibacillus campinasensis]